MPGKGDFTIDNVLPPCSGQYLSLPPDCREFAAGLLLVGSTRTKRVQDLAFDPFPTFHRFEQVNNSTEIQRRNIEESRMAALEIQTIERYHPIIAACFNNYGGDLAELQPTSAA